MSIKDSLGDRMKSKYEDVFRHGIPQRTYGILRIDGKAFHTYTKKLPRPFCPELSACMDAAAMALCREMSGARLAYGQSDEYSFLFTDFENVDSQMWFNGNIQKIASVSASIFTAHFAEASALLKAKYSVPKVALFDSRVFVIPSRLDVINYFVWRQQDASRNSLSMLAASHFSHKQLHGKKAADMHDMLHGIGINWNNERTGFKRGRVIKRMVVERPVSYTHKVTKEVISKVVSEPTWVVDEEIPVFTQDYSYLDALVPSYEGLSAKAGV